MNSLVQKMLPYLLPAVAGFVIAIALFGSRVKERDRVLERTIVRLRIDTVHDVVRVPLRPLRIVGHSTNRESGFRSPDSGAFMTLQRCTELDTLISGDSTALAADTLHAKYCFDSDWFDIRLGLAARRVPVSIPVLMHDTVTERSTVESEDRQKPWYEEALEIFGAAAVGYLVGRR